MTTTSTPTGSDTTTTERHLGELVLRRYLAGETFGSDQAHVAAHATACGVCVRRIEGLREEQRSFEEQISFDRFAAGVSRAARVPAAGTETGAAARAAGRWWNRPATTRSFAVAMSVSTLAAGFALVIGVRPLIQGSHRDRPGIDDGSGSDTAPGAGGPNRLKGDADVSVQIAGAQAGAPQRIAASDAPEALAAGERLRVGVAPGKHRFVFVVSLDDQGTVTPIYPEVGSSLPLPRRRGMQYLPDSVELTGRGTERLVVLVTDAPLDSVTVRRAATVAFRKAGGDVGRLPALALPGDQFHRTFIKP
jgi:hypothetical protein